MKKAWSITILVVAISLVHARTYNVLSCDGGGIRGILPAKVIEYMEVYAYEYAEKQGLADKIPLYKNYKTGETKKVVHMSLLFDMMAGTSTGSIIAAGLSYPTEPGS